MDNETKLALFNQMLTLENMAQELDDVIANGGGNSTYDFKLNKTANEVLSNIMAQSDTLYLAFATLGIAKEYINWSISL